MAKPRQRHRQSRNRKEDDMVKALDDLTAFEQFKIDILPALRTDIRNKLAPDKIFEKYQSIAAAREVMVVVGKSPALASKAARGILDRTMGKPVETRIEKKRYEDLNDTQMQALLTSKFDEMKRAAPAVQSSPAPADPTKETK